MELGTKNLSLDSRSHRVVGEEITKVRVIKKRATGDERSVGELVFTKGPFIDAEVSSHKGAA